MIITSIIGIIVLCSFVGQFCNLIQRVLLNEDVGAIWFASLLSWLVQFGLVAYAVGLFIRPWLARMLAG